VYLATCHHGFTPKIHHGKLPLFFVIPINIRDVHFFSSFLLPLVLCKLYVIALAFVAFSHIALGFVASTLTSALHIQEM
jgi:hypothetical protein